MNKVLILTCSTGEGHNSAARAIETILCQKGITCEVADPVSFQSERMQRMVSSIYNNTIRKKPAVFGAVYKLGDLYSSSKLPSPVYYANAHYSDSLKKYITENKFDAVVCTHLYGMEAMTAIRKKDTFPVPCYGILTDYTCIPFLDETNLNGYFVPTQEVKKRLIEKGIPEESIWISGIPVDESFRFHPSREEARYSLQIPDEKKVFLVMTGGVGCENMESLCRQLMKELTDNCMLLVLAGKNQELQDRLNEQYRDNNRIQTVSFTREVPLYMAASDVLLSKPGGLSSTEAAVANIPLIHIHAIPGCESRNAEFFSKCGLSFCAKNDADAVKCAKTLADHPEIGQEMIKMQRMYINPNAAADIVQRVMEG